VLKRKINDTKCYPFFLKYEGCGICLKVCPIHRFGYAHCMKAFQGPIPELPDGSPLALEKR